MIADVLTMRDNSDKPITDIKYAYVGDTRSNMGQPESRRWNSQVETGTPPKVTILVLSSGKGPNLPRWAS